LSKWFAFNKIVKHLNLIFVSIYTSYVNVQRSTFTTVISLLQKYVFPRLILKLKNNSELRLNIW